MLTAILVIRRLQLSSSCTEIGVLCETLLKSDGRSFLVIAMKTWRTSPCCFVSRGEIVEGVTISLSLGSWDPGLTVAYPEDVVSLRNNMGRNGMTLDVVDRCFRLI